METKMKSYRTTSGFSGDRRRDESVRPAQGHTGGKAPDGRSRSPQGSTQHIALLRMIACVASRWLAATSRRMPQRKINHGRRKSLLLLFPYPITALRRMFWNRHEPIMAPVKLLHYASRRKALLRLSSPRSWREEGKRGIIQQKSVYDRY
jgi:hypothetical protein